jgi:hypothetical protein
MSLQGGAQALRYCGDEHKLVHKLFTKSILFTYVLLCIRMIVGNYLKLGRIGRIWDFIDAFDNQKMLEIRTLNVIVTFGGMLLFQ